MRVFSFFELFLIVFTFYAILILKGNMSILVPILCLVTVFLLEKLQGRFKEDEEARERFLRYKREDYMKRRAVHT